MKPTISILCDKRTPRLHYIAHWIFEERLRWTPILYTDAAAWANAEGPRLNYSSTAHPGIPHVWPMKLLFEKRVAMQDIAVEMEDTLPLFFANKCELRHDPLAACFYFLSRYEEYLPFRADDHGRFPASESLLARYHGLQVPVVDHYIARLGHWLRSYYPALSLPVPQAQMLITVDVDQLFQYHSRGIARSLMGMVKDALVDRKSFSARFSVLTGQRRDPLDQYDVFIERCGGHHLRPLYFFQVGEMSRFDINNPIHLPYVRNRIHEISLRADVGLHPSYFSSDDPQRFAIETERLRTATTAPVTRSRQHYLRMRMGSTMRSLVDVGVKHDHSLGFADAQGFRAGTSFSFPFFDLEREDVLDLRMHPFQWMDLLALRTHSSEARIFDELRAIWSAVKLVGGSFTTVWHPDALIGRDVPMASWSAFEFLTDLQRD